MPWKSSQCVVLAVLDWPFKFSYKPFAMLLQTLWAKGAEIVALLYYLPERLVFVLHKLKQKVQSCSNKRLGSKKTVNCLYSVPKKQPQAIPNSSQPRSPQRHETYTSGYK